MKSKELLRGILNNYRTKLFFALLVLFLLRCGGNYQKGQYIVNYASASSLANDRGMVGIVKGSKLDDEGNMGGGIFALYFLVAVPEGRFTGLGAKNDNRTYESLFEYTWFEKDKSKKDTAFVLKITWDRKKDFVNIYDADLNRQNGNAFLIMFDKDMKPLVKQFKGLDADNEEDILAFYKNQDKDNIELSKLLIYRK
jgi:hypothetical protein